MILGTLVAMVCMLGLLAMYRAHLETEALHADGSQLAHLLSSTDVANNPDGGLWMARILRSQADASPLLYGLIQDADGRTLASVHAPDSARSLPTLPGSSISERVGYREIGVGDRDVLEFYGRMLGSDETYRIGYDLDAAYSAWTEMPYMAAVLLPVALLLTFCVRTLRTSLRPIAVMNDRLADCLATGDLTRLTVSANGDLEVFVNRFNRLIENARNRIDASSEEAAQLVTSEKFLNYRVSRYESILHTVPDGLLVLNDDKEVSFANSRALSILGRDRSELSGRKLSTVIDYEPLKEFAHSFELRSKLSDEEVRMPFPNNARYTLAASVHPIFFRSAQQESGGLLILLRDVTRETLAQESRGDFVAHVSHEVKTPLNTIGLYAEALQGEDGNNKAFRIEAQNVIVDEVQKLSQLINNLLSITQIEMGTMEIDRQRTRLEDLAREVFETAQRSQPAGEYEFELNVGDNVTGVMIDKDLMRIALNNLMTNAIKYSDPGATVTMNVSENDEAVTISVSDTGIGIAEDDQKKIFDKFFRSENESTKSRSGHGLGLPIAHQIVQLHHGTLRVQSQLGEGSTFSIDLWKNTGVMQQAI